VTDADPAALSDASGQPDRSGPPFAGVVYQVYPRSFRDGNGDGIGDLIGLRAGLEHLAWLGIDAVWSSPLYRSPMADFGYDVADHCDVDPVFGTLADLDAVIADAHAAGIAVWLDWVPNHTSDQHPWFLAARSSREDPHRDWYVWRDPAPDGGPPNNWGRHFAVAPAWTLDEASGQYYLHHFLPAQPDVNWDDPGLLEAQLDVLRFWQARGVDGFRADVVHLIGQDRTYPDDPPTVGHAAGNDGRAEFHSHPSTLDHLRAVRRVLDTTGALIVGEITLPDPRDVLPHLGAAGLHLSHVFNLLPLPWEADAWAHTIAEVDAAYAPAGQWPAWILGNHDRVRVATRVGGVARARAAAVVQLTLRGVPFIYQGEELGLEDAEIPVERVVDPGGRDGCRAPVPWEPTADGGWGDRAWLPAPPDAAARSVAAQREDPASTVHLYRRLLTLRRTEPVLVRGAQRVLGPADDVPAGVLAVERRAGGARTVTLARMGRTPVTLGPAWSSGGWVVAVDSIAAGAREGLTFDGHLVADSALVLRAVR
jgi:alpha-glucosidase